MGSEMTGDVETMEAAEAIPVVMSTAGPSTLIGATTEEDSPTVDLMGIRGMVAA